MMHYIYVLQSLKNGSLYIGYTENVKQRISEHNRKENLSTKSFAPWKVIFLEGYLNKKDVRRREKYLKTNIGSRLLKRMLKEYFWENRQF